VEVRALCRMALYIRIRVLDSDTLRTAASQSIPPSFP
jgi:hypothetical protein